MVYAAPPAPAGGAAGPERSGPARGPVPAWHRKAWRSPASAPPPRHRAGPSSPDGVWPCRWQHSRWQRPRAAQTAARHTPAPRRPVTAHGTPTSRYAAGVARGLTRSSHLIETSGRAVALRRLSAEARRSRRSGSPRSSLCTSETTGSAEFSALPERMFQPAAKSDLSENDLHTGAGRAATRLVRSTRRPKSHHWRHPSPPRLGGRQLCDRLVYALTGMFTRGAAPAMA
jgi:hypothetical protein